MGLENRGEIQAGNKTEALSEKTNNFDDENADFHNHDNIR